MTLVPYKGYQSPLSALIFLSPPARHVVSRPNLGEDDKGRNPGDPPPRRSTTLRPLRVRPLPRRRQRRGRTSPPGAHEQPQLDGGPSVRPGTALLAGAPGPRRGDPGPQRVGRIRPAGQHPTTR